MRFPGDYVGTALSVTCAVAAVCGTGFAQNEIRLSFSDPTRPGRLEAQVVDGHLTILGDDGSDVRILIDVDDDPVGEEEAAGLTRILGDASVTASEANNVVTLRAGWDEDADLTIRVPSDTALVLDVADGDVEITGVRGGIELDAADGDVTLNDVYGPVLVSAADGDIRATVSDLRADAPSSFSSLDGDIDLTLPGAAAMTMTLRAMDGEIYTDFDIDFDGVNPLRDPNGNPARTIRGTVNGGGLELGLQTMDGNILLRRGN